MRGFLLVIVAMAGCSGEPRPRATAWRPAPAGSADAAPAELAGAAVPAPPSARDHEQRFLAAPTSGGAQATIERLAARPHVAGTRANEEVGDAIVGMLGGLGIQARGVEYQVYLPFPRELSLRVRGTPPLVLAATEPGAPGQAPELWAWNAYSASGKVSAPVIYAGYGRDEDFARLRAAKVDPRGKVALLRYGPLYRGAQAASAERNGAAAVIFYVDPKDECDRPRESVQRGTVAYYWQYTGDPLTPGVASTPDAKRVAPAAAASLPKIPVLNISASDAARLHARIGGPEATGDLAGAAPDAATRCRLADRYHLGPGPIVDVTVALDGQTRTIRDLIATIPGRTTETVVLGNHYDAWGPGAVDPHSGTATLLEIARGLAVLGGSGWKPRRTLVLAFWDAEEHGVIGSTEWVEDQQMMLGSAVAYFNIDTLVAGPLVVPGSPALRELVRGCAAEVADPATGAPFAPTFRDLGIGSDWTAFLHHAGVPSLQWQGGPGKGAFTVWHSVQDTAAYARSTADPDLAAVPAYAKVMGLCALRLAEAERLPLRYTETAAWLGEALAALAKTNDDGPKLALDRPQIDAAIGRLRDAATRAEASPGSDRCNAALIAAERGFLAPPGDGITGRPWYRHLATGPEPANGYGARRLPELVAALAARDQAALDRATGRLRAAIDRVAAALAPCGGPD